MALHEFLADFVAAAAAADAHFVRTGDAHDIREGIAVWEQLTATDALAGARSGALVDAYLAVSMLYARRQESGDLSLALRYLQEARRYIVPGSFADLQARMSRAGCLLVRYQADREREDLDGAIEGWTRAARHRRERAGGGQPRARAAGRHELTGEPGDLRDGRRLLGRASAEMPHDHPARRDVELALRAAG